MSSDRTLGGILRDAHQNGVLASELEKICNEEELPPWCSLAATFINETMPDVSLTFNISCILFKNLVQKKCSIPLEYFFFTWCPLAATFINETMPDVGIHV